MTIRTLVITSFITGSIFGAAVLGWFEDSPKPSGTLTPEGARGVDSAGSVATGNDLEGCFEDLGDNDYDAMLYATRQSNRVMLVRLRNNSVAQRAGIREGSVVWSYDGQRIFHAQELATLSTTGRHGDYVNIAIVTPDGTEQHVVERNPLGADLVATKEQPNPN